MNRPHSRGRKIILCLLISLIVLGVFWWLGQRPLLLGPSDIYNEPYEKDIEGTSYIGEIDGIITELFFDGTSDNPYSIALQTEDKEELEYIDTFDVPCHRISETRYPLKDLKIGQRIRAKVEIFVPLDPEWQDWVHIGRCESIIVLDEA